MSRENSPVVCDGYVKYEEAEADRLDIIKKYRNNGKKQIARVHLTIASRYYRKSQ